MGVVIDMFRKSIIILILLVILAGCSLDTTKKMKSVSDTGSVIILNNNEKLTVGLEEEIDKEDLVLDFYFESNSGSAIMAYSRMKDSLKEMVLADDLKLRLHPLIYLNNRSDLGSSYLIGKVMNALAETDPSFVLPFLDEVLKENHIDIDEDSIKELMMSWSFEEKHVEKIMNIKENYHQNLVEGSKRFMEMKDIDMPYFVLSKNGTKKVFKVDDIHKIVEEFEAAIASLTEKDEG